MRTNIFPVNIFSLILYPLGGFKFGGSTGGFTFGSTTEKEPAKESGGGFKFGSTEKESEKPASGNRVF